MYFCYLLRCSDGSLYTGITTDPARRLKQHNCGQASKYTAARRPVRLVWKEKLRSRSSALRREAQIKRWPRRRKQALIRRTRRRRTR
jgi:putative endonuclease